MCVYCTNSLKQSVVQCDTGCNNPHSGKNRVLCVSIDSCRFPVEEHYSAYLLSLKTICPLFSKGLSVSVPFMPIALQCLIVEGRTFLPSWPSTGRVPPKSLPHLHTTDVEQPCTYPIRLEPTHTLDTRTNLLISYIYLPRSLVRLSAACHLSPAIYRNGNTRQARQRQQEHRGSKQNHLQLDHHHHLSPLVVNVALVVLRQR